MNRNQRAKPRGKKRRPDEVRNLARRFYQGQPRQDAEALGLAAYAKGTPERRPVSRADLGACIVVVPDEAAAAPGVQA